MVLSHSGLPTQQPMVFPNPAGATQAVPAMSTPKGPDSPDYMFDGGVDGNFDFVLNP